LPQDLALWFELHCVIGHDLSPITPLLQLLQGRFPGLTTTIDNFLQWLCKFIFLGKPGLFAILCLEKVQFLAGF
jgi:hypothetical protein